MVPRTKIAPMLRRARRRRGWTLADVASRLDCTPSAVCQYETGARMPNIPTFGVLVRVLKIDPAAALRVAVGDR